VQLLPDPPSIAGAIVQLGERLLCKQEVGGSIPPGSTSSSGARECDVEIALHGYAEQSFDRTVGMSRAAL
jgi:hypothetical protein